MEILAIALVMLMSSASARFVVETNSIRILYPENIEGNHDGAIANFGVPEYGGSLIGVVVYPEKGRTGCGAFHTSFKSKSKRPVILLLDRGDCHFALKAWNGQQSGASAVIVADNIDEPLLTMDNPQETQHTDYLDKINIPSALVVRKLGDTLKQQLAKGTTEVVVRFDWTESMPHPDRRVEYEFWTNSNDECGPRCDAQMNFIRDFKGHAQLLEKGGFAQFTPHYITWHCPESFKNSKQCRAQCINHGRYCAPDPEGDFSRGYDGRDVVVENLRQICVHRVAEEFSRPWVWWDFVDDYRIRCSMKENKYSRDCAEGVVKSLNISLDEVTRCMGDPEDNVDNVVLSTEQEHQVGGAERGDVTMLPTLVINNVQYRGKLERAAVLKAICAGFKETTEPSICLSQDIQTNECLESNGGCWHDQMRNITACKDTFRGRVCECPTVSNVRYEGDGYTNCTAVGLGRCSINNGRCWSESRDGKTFSACNDDELSGCRCPHGFYGDGFTCYDIDECKEKNVCSCPECSCKNTWGSYECKCKGNSLYIKEQDQCLANNNNNNNAPVFGWIITLMVLMFVAGSTFGGYIFYKYRLRSYMDSEIMAIMSQYMPLDQQQSHSLRQHSSA